MENRRISLDNAGEVTDEKPDFGLNSDSDLARCNNEPSLPGVLLWLKRVAVDPGKLEACSRKAGFNAQKLLNESNKEFLERKRKHDLIQEVSKATSKLSPKRSKQKSFVRLSKGQCTFTTSVPSLLSHIKPEESSQLTLQNPLSSVSQAEFCNNISRKCIIKDPSTQANAMKRSNPPNKETPSVLDSDDSYSDSNPLISKKETSQTPDKSVKGAHFPVKQILNLPTIEPDLSGKSSPSIKEVSPAPYSDESVSSSNPSLPAMPQKHQTPQKPFRSMNLIGHDIRIMAIPVGPRFQAEVPDWTGPPKMYNLSDSNGNLDNSKWLGTKIWPIGDMNVETSTKLIRKEIHNSCSCSSPGSTECIKIHIAEERMRLQSELGPAFFSWKFDEMGEEVSNSWTPKEQKSFEDLVRKNPMSDNKVFWRTAFKCLPGKRRESIVSYYFNVHVLRRISRQTRSACTTVDTDEDDEADESVQKPKMGNHYLTQLR